MNELKTIAAISTALSPSGVGVIRVCGKDAFDICDKVFRGKKSLKETEGYKAIYGKIYSPSGEFIDETVATVFRSPNSYTGEDTVEFSCHGSPLLLRLALRAIVENGAVLAGKGEFTKRALLNKKLTLTEAEAVIDIINAESRLSAKCAFSNKNGALYKKLNEIAHKIINLQAELSAVIDFPDEDLTDLPLDEVLIRLKESLKDLKMLYDSFGKGQLIKRGIDVAIVGKPNAGKSSVMNLLAGNEKSIVTDIAGTTRDVVETSVMLGDIILNLSDTAGIRTTEDSVEKIGVQKALDRIYSSQLVLCIFDGSQPLNEEDRYIIKETEKVERIAVINKSDLSINQETVKEFHSFSEKIIISAKTGDGLDKLEEIIKTMLGLSEFDPDSGIIANERQFETVKSALSSLNEAVNSLEAGMTEDVVGLLLEETINSLLSLSGERATDKIIENVFSRFCVGK